MEKLRKKSSEIEDLAVQCIRCGFCLEACPTFKISGSELESPRGRIYLIRSAEEGVLSYDQIQPHIDHCVGCLACETACPSGVHYGQLMELARENINESIKRPAREKIVDITVSKWALRSSILLSKLTGQKRMPNWMSKWVSGEPTEANTPTPQKINWPAFESTDLPEILGEVYFLKGCAMDVLFPNVHEASKRLIRRVGYQIKEVKQGCCGSMHAHQGYLDIAKKDADSLINAMDDDLPVIVDSAGCGSTMKRYADLIPGPDAEEFAKRTFDISEFLIDKGLISHLQNSKGLEGKRVTYHEACHLAHGQGIRTQPRELLNSIPGIELIELEESDTCCGSAGVYNVLEPKIARALLDRKMEMIAKTAAEIVVLGNPGCHAWMFQGSIEKFNNKVKIMHISEILEASFVGLPS